MTRVYVDMVADLFHYGHVEFLRQAGKLGDVVVVGIHSDETAAAYKRLPVMTMEERIHVVAACRHVDEVLADAPLKITAEWLERHAIDLVAHGDDFDEETLISMYPVPHELGVLRTVPYTQSISTREILARVGRRLQEGT
jgi:cytidyltransferase-like protein